MKNQKRHGLLNLKEWADSAIGIKNRSTKEEEKERFLTAIEWV